MTLAEEIKRVLELDGRAKENSVKAIDELIAESVSMASIIRQLLEIVKRDREALGTAKQALAMLASEIPKLKADTGSDPRLATPANYAASLSDMASKVVNERLTASEQLTSVMDNSKEG